MGSGFVLGSLLFWGLGSTAPSSAKYLGALAIRRFNIGA